MTCVVCKFCGFDLRDSKMYFCALDNEQTHAERECNLYIPIDDEGEEFHFIKEEQREKQIVVNTRQLLEPW